jgi:glycosyltransferase involved in cell wall biosynthesis
MNPKAQGKTDEKKVLMLAYFFPPLGGGGVQRTSKFAKYLPDSGWTPVVVTVKESAYWVRDRSLEEDLPPGTDVERTSSPSVFHLLRFLPGGGMKPSEKAEASGVGGAGERSGAMFSFLRRLSSFFLVPDQYVGWVPFAVAAALRCMRRHAVSVLYSTSSPDSTHLAALAVKRLTRRPWIADFRDPWVERLTFNAPTPLHLGLHRFLEGRVVKYADRVLCTSEETVIDFLKKYPLLPRDKFVVITNGFDPEDFVESVPLQETFTITHTGNLTGKRNCFGFLEGLRMFLDKKPEARSKTRVVFIGPRDRENELKAQEWGLKDVVCFQDSLPHKECVRFQLSSHLLLLIEHYSRRGAMIYPAKLFEYAASGRPVLALVPDGPASRFVRDTGAGEVVSSSDAASVCNALSRFFSEYESGKPRDGVSDRSVLDPYERPRLARELARLLDGFGAP